MGALLVVYKIKFSMLDVFRSSVAKVLVLGTFSLEKYSVRQSKPVKARECKFSSCLLDMIVCKENLYVLDSGRGEIIVIRGVSKVGGMLSCLMYVIPISDCRSVSCVAEHLLLLKTFDQVLSSQILVTKVDFPKSKKGQYSLSANLQVIHTVEPLSSIQSLFHISGSLSHFGAVSDKNMVYFFVLSNNQVECIETGVETAVRPCASTSLVYIQEGIQINAFRFGPQERTLEKSDSFQAISATGIKALHIWGDTLYIIRKSGANAFCLEEHGSLLFGFQFCEAVDTLYNVIGYCPPHQQRVKSASLAKCIESVDGCVRLLTGMQQSKEDLFPSRKSFSGVDGMPFTATIDCLVSTIESWKALFRRVKFLDPMILEQIDTHAIMNESWVEHSFGFSQKRGQGNLQNMQEYVQNKRLVALDFQTRMCKTPFSQYVATKVRDKGYQQLSDEKRLELPFKELLEIFDVGRKSSHEEETHTEVYSEACLSELKRAYLLSKSVPRQTNRSKWREASGHAPNMLRQDDCPTGMLLSGDMVFFFDVEGKLVYLIVKEDTKLVAEDAAIAVNEIGAANSPATMHILVSKLATDQGMIATIPHQLYTVSEEGVKFDEHALDLVESLKGQTSSIYSDEDLVLVGEHVNAHKDSTANTFEESKLVDVVCGKEREPESYNSTCRASKRSLLPPPSSDVVTSYQKEMDAIAGPAKRTKKKKSCDDGLVSSSISSLGVRCGRSSMMECWTALVSPSAEQLNGKWVACIYSPCTKQKSRVTYQLIFGKLVGAEVADLDNEPNPARRFVWQVDCCKPYCPTESGIVHEVPRTIDGKGGDLWRFYVPDIFCIEVMATYVDKGKWKITNADDICQLFHEVKATDRDGLFLPLFQ